MTTRRIRGVVPLVVVLAVSATAAASDYASKSAVRRFEKATSLRLRFDRVGTANIAGKSLRDQQRLETIERLLPWLATYPSGFVTRVIDEIVVLNDLVIDGVVARGHRNDRRVYLQYSGASGDLSKGDLDHEIFHALDGSLAELGVSRAFEAERQRAVRLRDLWEDYRLTPSHRYTFNWGAAVGKAPWVAYVPVVGILWMFGHDHDAAPEGFASRRGTVAPREDRATVAEALLSGDGGFLRRASDDRELREKVAIVRAMYEAATDGAMNAAFWSRLAGGSADVPSLGDLEARLAAVATPARLLPPVRAGGEVVSVAPAPASTPRAVRKKPVARDPVARDPVVLAGPPVRAVIPEPAKAEAAPASREKPEVLPPAAAVAGGSVAENRERAPAEAYAEGTAAFASGDHARAASLWRDMVLRVDPDYATIQIAINCAFDNVIKNQQALAGSTSFYALAYGYGGKDCHLSLTGLYRNRDDAVLAIEGLPASIREQRPRAVRMRDLASVIATTEGVERHGTR